MGVPLLQDLIDRWLRGSWYGYGLRFPAPLEYRFEADTSRARSRMLAAIGTIGFLTALMLVPRLRATLPDMAPEVATFYLGLCIPAGLAAVLVLLLNPRPLLREVLIAVTHTAGSLCVIVLFLASKSADMAVFAGTVTLLMVYGAVGLQLRFPFAVWSVAGIFFAEAIGLRLRAAADEHTVQNLLILSACTGAYTLLANWRMERQHRRNYLVSLRERLEKHDMTLRNKELDELSRRDPLTGLANRRAYDLWLARAWQQTVETGAELGLIVIDIDHFKLYNDFYGHAAGDTCLQVIARSLGEQLRGTSDLVVRMGGEEFAVLLPRLQEHVCADVAERLRVAVEALELPHMGLGQSGLVSVSAGVASRLAGGADTPDKLFAAADAALYCAKQAGRNRVWVSTDSNAQAAQTAGD